MMRRSRLISSEVDAQKTFVSIEDKNQIGRTSVKYFQKHTMLEETESDRGHVSFTFPNKLHLSLCGVSSGTNHAAPCDASMRVRIEPADFEPLFGPLDSPHHVHPWGACRSQVQVVDVNIKDASGHSPLMVAVGQGNLACAEVRRKGAHRFTEFGRDVVVQHPVTRMSTT
jgi:hypothetical protein